MKFFVSLVLIAVVSFAACLYLPWWVVAIVAFAIIAIIPQRPLAAFLCGFAAIFILWFGLSFWLSASNNHILAHRVSMLILKADQPLLLILLSACIGALVAGLGAMTASYIREVKTI